MAKLGMWEPLHGILVDADESDLIKRQALWVAGTAVQNNPSAQHSVNISTNVVHLVSNHHNLSISLIHPCRHFFPSSPLPLPLRLVPKRYMPSPAL
jgi:hypothetical protein